MPKANNEHEILNKYDKKFYSDQIDGSTLSASIVIPLVLKVLPGINSVVDFGCGVGTWLAEFKRQGINTIHGYDGGNPPEGYLLIDNEEYHKVDFTKELPVQEKADLAVSLEVAEHLDERFASAFVKNLCHQSDMVLFSAAIPGQGGTHHVNERWPSYWAALFKNEGYLFFDVIRPQIWYDKRVEFWYRQNIFLVINQENKDTIEAIETHIQKLAFPIDSVHPDMHVNICNALEKNRNNNQNVHNDFLPRMDNLLTKILKRILPNGVVRQLGRVKRKLSH